MHRKEYVNRWEAELVNPGFTMAEYEAKRVIPVRHCEGLPQLSFHIARPYLAASCMRRISILASEAGIYREEFFN